jgi:two-component system sensor histidine kinase/response regulator
MTNPDQKTILIIEDSRTQFLHLQLLLEEHGLRAAWAETGLKGADMAQELRPDLIILDLRLPDIDGLQVAERLRLKSKKAVASIPIILMTRYGDADLIQQALQMGIDEYIPKDAFADAVLIETLRRMGLITSQVQ